MVATIRTLTADTVSFTQANAFGDTALFTFATDTLNLTTSVDQTVHNWMTSGNRALSLFLRGSSTLTIGANVSTGTGDLDFDRHGDRAGCKH